MNWFLLLISSLAIFRLSELLAKDNGPFHMFKKLRSSFPSGGRMDELFRCYYCLSGWFSLFMYLILAAGEVIRWSQIYFWWPGMWGGAVFIYRIVRPRDDLT